MVAFRFTSRAQCLMGHRPQVRSVPQLLESNGFGSRTVKMAILVYSVLGNVNIAVPASVHKVNGWLGNTLSHMHLLP